MTTYCSAAINGRNSEHVILSAGSAAGGRDGHRRAARLRQVAPTRAASVRVLADLPGRSAGAPAALLPRRHRRHRGADSRARVRRPEAGAQTAAGYAR